LKSHRKAILEVQEASWRLKNRSIWLNGGEKTPNYSKLMLREGSSAIQYEIFKMGEGSEVSNFDGLASL